MPNITRNIPSGSDLGKRILGEMRARVRASERGMSSKLRKWSEAEDTTMAYIPEREADRLRKKSRQNGLPEYTTIQIPYSYAVLMAAHTYITSVFLGRSPIQQLSGRHGESEQQVQAMEALLDYQMTVGRILVPLYIWLYDSLKYGAGIGQIYWEDRIESFTTVTEQDELDAFNQPTGRTVKLQRSSQFKTYGGNKFRNVQPQDFLWDTRYPIWDFQSGEYCATKFSLNWNEVVRRASQGYWTNIDEIKSKYTGDQFQTNSSSSSLERPETTDSGMQQYDITEMADVKHPTLVKGYEVYIEIIPKEWGLGSSTYPEKWVFSSTGDFGVLLGVQPLGHIHCKFPFSVLCLEPEGYGLTVRGFNEILEPVQQTVDWLINSHFFNVRAALNNRWIVDPSKIIMKDLLNPLPGGIVRLKPEAYGSDPRLAVSQFNVQDVTQNHLRDLQLMLGIGERTVGINDQIMGMLNAGGRKTATEVRTSTSFGVNRLKTISEFYSVSGFDPLAQIMIQNSQQFYDDDMKFKIAGDLMTTGGQMITVKPDLIAGFYDFVPVDGTLPIDRFAQMNIWMTMFGQIRNFPELLVSYDIGRIFEYVARLGGMKNIGQFKVQLGSPEALQRQAMLGNTIPLGGRSQPKGPTPPGATSPEPGQIAGMGATG